MGHTVPLLRKTWQRNMDGPVRCSSFTLDLGSIPKNAPLRSEVPGTNLSLQNRERNRVSAVRIRRLTAWAMEWPMISLLIHQSLRLLIFIIRHNKNYAACKVPLNNQGRQNRMFCFETVKNDAKQRARAGKCCESWREWKMTRFSTK
jgi:hypothetical protein